MRSHTRADSLPHDPQNTTRWPGKTGLGQDRVRKTSMTDLVGQPASAKQRRRGASIGLVFALAALVILIVAAAAFVALVLWPRWPAATVTPDTPALPITVGGVLFNVPPGAI